MRNGSKQRYLHTYLNDHWAAAGAGVALVRRVAQENAATEWSGQLEAVAQAIVDDDDTLTAIRRTLGVGGGAVRRSVAIAAERVSRLKLNGRLVRYSPLSRVIETEGLLSGIAAKRQLWITLHSIVVPELAHVDIDRLVERADSQLAVVRAFHHHAAVVAFQD
jgi:hypothetical protein